MERFILRAGAGVAALSLVFIAKVAPDGVKHQPPTHASRGDRSARSGPRASCHMARVDRRPCVIPAPLLHTQTTEHGRPPLAAWTRERGRRQRLEPRPRAAGASAGCGRAGVGAAFTCHHHVGATVQTAPRPPPPAAGGPGRPGTWRMFQTGSRLRRFLREPERKAQRSHLRRGRREPVSQRTLQEARTCRF